MAVTTFGTLGVPTGTWAKSSRLGITMLGSTGPAHIHLGGTIRFHVRVKGLTLDRHYPGHAKKGHGHVQVYLNQVPGDAYHHADLKTGWLASVAVTTFVMQFPEAVLHAGKGSFTVCAALARDNDVLYRVPPAKFRFRVT